jgi:hypothetical protein
MRCSKCEEEISNKSSFCLHCGANVARHTSTANHKSGSLIALYIFLGIILGVVGLAIILHFQKTNQSPSISTSSPVQSAPKPAPVWIETSQDIASGAFTVGARTYVYYDFMVDQSWRKVRLNGRFQAQGGWGNDITVLLTDEDGFTNWQNGHNARVWYNSGKVTIGTINVTLPPGHYYLVFSNTFALISNKAVNATILLFYEYLTYQ